MRLIYFLFCFCLFSNTIFASENFHVVEDLHAAFSLSEENEKPILLIFSADWCKYCNYLKDDIAEFKDIDRFIICIIDSDKEKILYKQMNIKNLPTSIVLDHIDFQEQTRKVGYIKKDYDRWLSSNLSE